jgi:hypothetical protein
MASPPVQGEVLVRRHLRKAIYTASLIILISPSECVFNYCVRHNFNPPICDEVLFPV